ncbi:hypothetical protein B6N60_01683 [Richelia sinica FACHB-800]|uniref:PrsW family intramembrane metalloprotease n=1 Tax=Richelia sinica FACHB-800 TaxID=1357546 RepID=A0A975Y4B0_9NOST|nr:PrsW family glutamic-type intramembrane protease [Richelia sinica]MBD2667396.1 PrsW family intramembrane metalloprotease [Richelia sinica FACHB-800]QXE22995.1 hypothetical protein B6N60_01683 [Richelia sinica FACHB-800]
MANFFILLWAVIPPLLLLLVYYLRTPVAPRLLRLLGFFLSGAISGFVAVGLEWLVDTIVHGFFSGQQISRSFLVVILRQILEIGVIEEGCKLAAAAIPIYYLQSRYRLRPTTVFLFSLTVCLGFTAEENWIYLFHGTAGVIDRIISTPGHMIFSAPWGYALGIYVSSGGRFSQYRLLVAKAWLNSVLSHALVNIVSIAWGYPLPLHFLGYTAFPLQLWMFWRLEQLLRKIQGKRPLTVISAHTFPDIYWQRGLVVLILLLGGNSILGLFLLAIKLSPLQPIQILQSEILLIVLGQILVNIGCGLSSYLLYRYLRYLAAGRFSH